MAGVRGLLEGEQAAGARRAAIRCRHRVHILLQGRLEGKQPPWSRDHDLRVGQHIPRGLGGGSYCTVRWAHNDISDCGLLFLVVIVVFLDGGYKCYGALCNVLLPNHRREFTEDRHVLCCFSGPEGREGDDELGGEAGALHGRVESGPAVRIRRACVDRGQVYTNTVPMRKRMQISHEITKEYLQR